jgi:hypothetical protein
MRIKNLEQSTLRFKFVLKKVYLHCRLFYFPFTDSYLFFKRFNWIPLGQASKYVTRIVDLSEAKQFTDREDIWKFCIEKINSSKIQSKDHKEFLVLEFGVWEGKSINVIAKLMPKYFICGFDSFFGLEEDWTGTKNNKETFNVNGLIPVTRENVRIIPGWFNETLPRFLEENLEKKIVLLHMDADTYTPTNFVLTTLHNNISSGTIIIFDEYFGYAKTWRLHEYKAFQEFIKNYKIKYRYLAFTNIQVAIEIL